MVEQAAALDELQHALRAEAARLGFAAIGFCDAEDDPLAGERLDAWLEAPGTTARWAGWPSARRFAGGRAPCGPRREA